MENILADLIQHIGQNMPEIRLVDEDYGQLENIDENSSLDPGNGTAIRTVSKKHFICYKGTKNINQISQ